MANIARYLDILYEDIINNSETSIASPYKNSLENFGSQEIQVKLSIAELELRTLEVSKSMIGESSSSMNLSDSKDDQIYDMQKATLQFDSSLPETFLSLCLEREAEGNVLENQSVQKNTGVSAQDSRRELHTPKEDDDKSTGTPKVFGSASHSTDDGIHSPNIEDLNPPKNNRFNSIAKI